MFHILAPVPALDTVARARVYDAFVRAHPELTDVPVGPHNDMIMLATDAVTGGAAAVLIANGKPGDRIDFPLHRHGLGEVQTCLEGTYGELVPDGVCLDDLFPYGTTLVGFQECYPGVVTLGERTAAGQELRLGPGATWCFVARSQHAPRGWIGASGVLRAQIYWPGPNEILAPAPAGH